MELLQLDNLPERFHTDGKQEQDVYFYSVSMFLFHI